MAANEQQVSTHVEPAPDIPAAGPISGRLRAPGRTIYQIRRWPALTAALESIRKLQSPKSARVSSRFLALTKTENEVAALVCEGLTNPQIAPHPSVSPRTVQGHLLEVFRKLNASMRRAMLRVPVGEAAHAAR